MANENKSGIATEWSRKIKWKERKNTRKKEKMKDRKEVERQSVRRERKRYKNERAERLNEKEERIKKVYSFFPLNFHWLNIITKNNSPPRKKHDTHRQKNSNHN